MRDSFWETRTAWRRLKERLLLEPLPGGARWAAAFGSLLLFSFLVQVFTGVLLSMNYSPSVESAWPSVHHITTQVRFGSLIRSLHHWGSSAMVILLLVHLVQVFVWGAYKKPRELTWMVGVLLLVLTLGLAFTGYLLPWDQKAYWATKVGLGIVSTTPGVGESVKTALQGGPQMGNLTLTRFFSIHVFVLPGLLIALVVVHLYLFRVHGVTPPWWESEAQLNAEQQPFWPDQAFKDAVFALAFLMVLMVWAYCWPAPLEAKADPSQPYEARPEWYFMFLFYLLQFFKGPYEVVGTVVLPATFLSLLFFWPLLDRTPARDPRRRPIAVGLLTLGTAGLLGLSVFAIATDVRMREPQAVLEKTPVLSPAGPLQQIDVAGLFNSHCVACHGVDGKGDKVRPGMPHIPDFTSLSWQLGQTDIHLVQEILEGKPPQMPAYGDKLRSEEITALAIYVRAFVSSPHPEVLPAATGSPASASVATAPTSPAATPTSGTEPSPAPTRHAELYATFCLACHDKDGRGRLVQGAMPTIPNLADAHWQESITQEAIVQSILNGKGPFMRPLKDKLSEAEARLLAAYVHHFPAPEVAVAPQPAPQQEQPKQPAEEPIPPADAAATHPRETDKAAPAPTNLPVPSAVPSDTSARITLAATQYRQYCLACHGTDGRGTAVRQGMPTIPDFKDVQWQSTRSSAQLTIGILDGYGKLMPPFRDHVSRPQAQALTAYIRAFGAPPSTAGAASPSGDLEERMRRLRDKWRELERQIQDLKPSP